MDISKVSASRIKTNKDCEFKYFIEYHIKYPPSREGNIYTEKGSAVHEALEFWTNAMLESKTDEDKTELDYEKTLRKFYAKTKLWTLDDRRPDRGFPHPVQKTCESCPWATKDSRCSIADTLISEVDGCPRPNFEDDLELVKRTLSRKDYGPLAIKDKKLKNKVLGTEVYFSTELGGVPVRGYMDLVVEVDQDTIEVIDYKSGNRAMNYDAAFKDAQVRIYGAVARQKWPEYKYVMVTLHYIRKNPVTVDLGPKDDELTIKSLQARYKEIVENVRPKRRKSWLCNYCIGWESCGELYSTFLVDGKFRLPVISCAHKDQDGPCWGGFSIENKEAVNVKNIHVATYACRGHIELHKGGEYVPKEDGDNKVA